MGLMTSPGRSGLLSLGLAIAVLLACRASTAPPAPSASGFSALSSGGITPDAHTCGIGSTGKTYCWGAGSYGRLGNGNTASSSVPVQVGGTQQFVAVSAGGYHACALTGAGQAFCWGRNNTGQLGNGGTTDAATPVAVSGTLSFAAIDAGAYHTCAVSTTGAGYCWGDNTFGQLGDASTTQRAAPTRVSGGLVLTAISAGGNTQQSHTCARTASGAAYCWGSNGFGQLGVVGGNSAMPVQVAGTLTFESVAAGGYHTCGRVSTAIYCWGYNGYGQLGSPGSSSTAPVQVQGGVSFKSIDVGGWTSCAVTQSNSDYCWGWGHYGERGDGVMSDAQSAPTAISGALAFAVISPGPYHTCGLTASGKVYCWGYNADGELGDGTTANSSTPSLVSTP